jgi:hypothetical protein
MVIFEFPFDWTFIFLIISQGLLFVKRWWVDFLENAFDVSLVLKTEFKSYTAQGKKPEK